MNPDNIKSYLIKKILPYDQRIQALSKSIETKDIELNLLKNAYKDLLKELEEAVGPTKFAEALKMFSITPADYDITDQEKLIILKLFDFRVPAKDCTPESLERLRNIKKIIHDVDLATLTNSHLFDKLVKSPEYSLLVDNPDFKEIVAQKRLVELIKRPEFQTLISAPNFKQLLEKHGLRFPLRPFDVGSPFGISILKSIAKLERIFEDFRTNRCAEYTSMKFTKPVRGPLTRSLSPSNNFY